MNFSADEITKSITGKFSLNQCDVDELQQLIHRYPFFGPAKFLLAKKLKQENSPLFNEQVQKASLYFQNPAWFDYLINNEVIMASPGGLEKEEAVFAGTSNMEIPVTQEEVVDQTQPGKISAPINEEEQDEEEQELVEVSTGLPADFSRIRFDPVDTSKAELTFEPYHTIDYFASQGIKSKEEEKSGDKLTKQLKSFTEWLKVMKRLPVSEITAAVTAVDEKKVEKMAETSINDREVVTETMAEVWEKQGNAAKASEVYKKLSLLNPSKSSYFAAKIEQLKNL